MTLQGQLVDIANRRIISAEIKVLHGKIQTITEKKHRVKSFLMPGFVDAHIHIESSMLVPSEFAQIAVRHGTVATVSDPHEIANVLGLKGVEFMLENAAQTPFKFSFGAPSCVPATNFETAGSVLDSNDVKKLLSRPDIKYLAEMMNFPGVLANDQEVLKKLAWAKHFNKPIDGHAPALKGENLTQYISAGITTDHESFTFEEGLEKLQKGMKILIREGSAAKNFEALIDLLPEHYQNIMFCSDDKHPDDLLLGHINLLCARAIAKGHDLFKVLRAACLNPVAHYNMTVGQLRPGDPADFILVEDLKHFKTLQTYLDGQLVFDNGTSLMPHVAFENLNNFNTSKKQVSDFRVEANSLKIRVIEALDGELVTNSLITDATIDNGNILSNTETDILKATVVNRYQDTSPVTAFIKNFGLKEGAIASSVGHDSHNIIAVGVNDEHLCRAVNLIIENKGGICAVSDKDEAVVPLPVAGIMSDQDAKTIADAYARLDLMAKKMGSLLRAPYMTLSFMALLVIPSLKLSDKGLFDGHTFEFVDLNL